MRTYNPSDSQRNQSPPQKSRGGLSPENSPEAANRREHRKKCLCRSGAPGIRDPRGRSSEDYWIHTPARPNPAGIRALGSSPVSFSHPTKTLVPPTTSSSAPPTPPRVVLNPEPVHLLPSQMSRNRKPRSASQYLISGSLVPETAERERRKTPAHPRAPLPVYSQAALVPPRRLICSPPLFGPAPPPPVDCPPKPEASRR